MEGGETPEGQGDSSPRARGWGDGSAAPAPREQRRTRKKVPIVNRRGPSEVDRAIRMSKASNGRSPGTGRRLPEGSMSHGTVVRIDRAKGFGFLVDSAGEQRFFHRSSVLDGSFAALKEQQAVEFQVHNDERGARALKVRPSSVPDRAAKPSPRPRPSSKEEKAPTWRSALSPFRSGTSIPSGSGDAKTRNRNRKP